VGQTATILQLSTKVRSSCLKLTFDLLPPRATGGRSVSTQTWLRIGLLFGSVFAEPDAPYILWLDQRGLT
jgi:hypothetical protein